MRGTLKWKLYNKKDDDGDGFRGDVIAEQNGCLLRRTERREEQRHTRVLNNKINYVYVNILVSKEKSLRD